MNSESIILLTKDAMCREYLPVYGNPIWRTPNIDELSQKGTVFHKYYTGAASTIMSNMCMCTGKFTFEIDMDDYYESNKSYIGDTLFDKASHLGYSCHIIWDESWYTDKTVEYYDCYGKTTSFHAIKDLRQGVGGHYKREKALEKDGEKTQIVYEEIESKLKDILQKDRKVFVWLHIPHVINGYTCYGEDIEAFDNIVGIVRKYFCDNSIFISADHGNMNGFKGKICYGYDAYDPIARIPLITPRLNNVENEYDLASNVDLYSILFEKVVPKREYVYCDTAFYAQAHRKLAIINEKYKYIYNKYTKKEELYDLEKDPYESCNLINDFVLDEDRLKVTPLREVFFYDSWHLLDQVRNEFRKELKRIWRKGTLKQELRARIRYFVKIHYFVPRIQGKDVRLNGERR